MLLKSLVLAPEAAPLPKLRVEMAVRDSDLGNLGPVLIVNAITNSSRHA